MATLEVGDVELCYDLRRKDDEPVILLISGLGGQLISWDDDLCDLLVEAGFGVLRFDNRDIGLSTSFDPAGAAKLDLASGLSFDPSSAPYNLIDMAGDAAGLLDALGIGAAHVVGVSMGGMIAQQLAISHPERVLSLCSIMSMTGAPDSEPPSDEALRRADRPSPRDKRRVHRESGRGLEGDRFARFPVRRAARSGAGPWRPSTGASDPPGWAPDACRSSLHPTAQKRSGHVEVPTLVIHGEDDPLVTVERGSRDGCGGSGFDAAANPGHGPRPAHRGLGRGRRSDRRQCQGGCHDR